MKFADIAFPFKSRLSLKPLIDFWEQLLTAERWWPDCPGPGHPGAIVRRSRVC